MRRFFSIAIVLSCWPVTFHSRAQSPPPDEHSTAINTAIVPVPKLENDNYDWFKRHAAILASKDKINPRIVLIGDSITHRWGEPLPDHPPAGPAAWKEAFGDLPVLNLGFGYDRTQNVLWRLDHGEFDGLAPKWVVINIGTNNIKPTANARANTPAEIVEGLMAVCERVHSKSPQSRLIVMAIFPRGRAATSELRQPIGEINSLLAKAVATHPEITYLDIGLQFLHQDGTLPIDMMKDGTHPTDKGYGIWAAALIKAGIQN